MLISRAVEWAPHSYLTPLKKAKEMLKNGTQIGIVAFDVGFSSQTYFGRCFKDAFNCTPKQYQQKIREEQGEA